MDFEQGLGLNVRHGLGADIAAVSPSRTSQTCECDHGCPLPSRGYTVQLRRSAPLTCAISSSRFSSFGEPIRRYAVSHIIGSSRHDSRASCCACSQWNQQGKCQYTGSKHCRSPSALVVRATFGSVSPNRSSANYQAVSTSTSSVSGTLIRYLQLSTSRSRHPGFLEKGNFDIRPRYSEMVEREL